MDPLAEPRLQPWIRPSVRDGRYLAYPPYHLFTEDDMRNQSIVGVSAALVVATAIGCAGALLAFNLGARGAVDPASATGQGIAPATSTPKPRPSATVTVTQRVIERRTVVEAPQNHYGADAEFLSAIARHGIKAPDGWAIEAGRTTCGTSYGYAYNYLTDGGLYGYHVQTFLDDWTATHQGC